MRPKSCVLGIVCRTIAAHLIRKAGFKCSTAHTGAVTLIQCFCSALNARLHVHILYLDGLYVEHPDGSVRFPWVKAPTSAELTALAHAIARRVGRYLERQGPLERDVENSYLAGEAVEAVPMDQLLGGSITYRIAMGPRAERKPNARSAALSGGWHVSMKPSALSSRPTKGFSCQECCKPRPSCFLPVFPEATPSTSGEQRFAFVQEAKPSGPESRWLWRFRLF